MVLRRSAIVQTILKRVSIVLLTLPSLSGADASLRPMESIEQSFKAAEIVALVRIDDRQTLDVEENVCGTRYTATLLETFKGEKDPQSRKIYFGRFLGLDTEKTYLVFLDLHDDTEAEYRRFRDENKLEDSSDETEHRRVMSLVACNGLVPGLAFNDRFTWPVQLSYVIVTGLLPTNIPDSIRTYPTDSAQWWIRKQDLFSYLHTLGGSKN